MDFNSNTDEFEELCGIAYSGKELSDYAVLPTKYMYLRLVDLYDCYAKGKLSKEKCVELKNMLKKEYGQLMKQHEEDVVAYREHALNRHKNAQYLIDIEKTTDKDEMLEIALKIIQNCIGDKSFYERNRNKMYEQNTIDF